MKKNLAVITGTSRGLGAALAEHLLEAKWKVIGISRSVPQLNVDEYEHISCDLRQGHAADFVSSELSSRIHIDGVDRLALINNAAQLDPVGLLRGQDFEGLKHAMDLNYSFPVCLMGLFRRMWPNKPLSVVNISSGAALKAYAGWGSYCSTKAALRMASMVFVEDEESLKAQSLRVLSYSPGVLDTQMQEQVRTTDKSDFPSVDRFKQLFEQGQLVDAKLPAAELVAYLSSDFEGYKYEEKRYGN